MSKFVSADVARRSHIMSLYLFILILSIVCGGLWYGWKTSPKNIRISIPPDMRSGAIVRPDEFHAANVHAFAMNTIRELNRWEVDGTVDYGTKILDLQHKLTPTFREYLIQDMNIKQKKGELKNRSRYALEVAGESHYKPENVTTIEDGVWVVDIKVEIVERVASTEAKRIKINYPIKVVRMNISPEKNMWGLALDGYTRRPESLDIAAVN